MNEYILTGELLTNVGLTYLYGLNVFLSFLLASSFNSSKFFCFFRSLIDMSPSLIPTIRFLSSG